MRGYINPLLGLGRLLHTNAGLGSLQDEREGDNGESLKKETRLLKIYSFRVIIEVSVRFSFASMKVLPRHSQRTSVGIAPRNYPL
jgi:hypothetical protein